MQYKVKVIHEEKGKVRAKVFVTPDVCAPSQDVGDHKFVAATEHRVVLGSVHDVPILMNGFGQVFAKGPACNSNPQGEYMLSGLPLVIRGAELRVELVPEKRKRKDDRPLWMRFRHWLAGSRCNSCFYFDRKAADEWRSQVTHTFDGGEKASMWDDVTKTAAFQAKVPDIPKEQFGHCAQQPGVALSGNLPACRLYRSSASMGIGGKK